MTASGGMQAMPRRRGAAAPCDNVVAASRWVDWWSARGDGSDGEPTPPAKSVRHEGQGTLGM